MSTNGQFNVGNQFNNNQNSSNAIINNSGSINNHGIICSVASNVITNNSGLNNGTNSQIQSPNFNQSSNKIQYRKKALDEIRQSLQPFMNERPTSSDDASSATSETSSNNFRNLDQYHHSNYHQTNAINKYQLTSPTNSIIISENGIDYYKSSIYTPSNASCSDKQSPTPTSLNSTLNSDFVQFKNLNGNSNNNNKLIPSSTTAANLYLPSNNGNQFNNNLNGNNQLPNGDIMPPLNNSVAKLQAWSVRQTKSQSPVIMQSVKSTQVQKPILQTACAPIIMNQQQIILNSQTVSQNRNQQQHPQQTNTQQQLQFNENSLKTDLVQLNPNIAKQFINKMISLSENSNNSINSIASLNSIYQKQQMPLPDPPTIKSPVHPLINDKSNNNNNCLDQYSIRTSSALSNSSSNSSKLTSYSTSSIASSSIHNNNFNHHLSNHNHINNNHVNHIVSHINNHMNPLPPPYPSKPTNILNKKINFNINNNTNQQQTVHVAKPITINNNNNNNNLNSEQLVMNQVNQINQIECNRPPPPPYKPPISESILNSTNNSEPPSYATSVLMKQQLNKQNKINRPLPPLPLNEGTSGPPLPPKPVKLIQQHQTDLNSQLIFDDELDLSCTNSSTFNASSNLHILQKQLEQHLQQQKPLVEKLKQIQMQKHQQKVLNLKANSNVQQQKQLTTTNANNLSPPTLPAKNNTQQQQSTNNKQAVVNMKPARPVPAPPLLPKNEKILNKQSKPIAAVTLNQVVPIDKQQNKDNNQNKKQNEYENTAAKGDNELISDDQQSNSSSCQGEQETKIITHHSPIPQRKLLSKEYEQERRESKVKNYSAAAYKFFMEQHIENVIKSRQQRENRKKQLENEMLKANLTTEAQLQMRKMLQQKESNYMRLRRARMDKSMFEHIKTLGVGAFGQVSLVKKLDTCQLYAMKTLPKRDIIKKNQFAHVKAERDILAEADNEWVVKLYYSFQDDRNLYFVMDYIPGGDLMNLLIRLQIFPEYIAQFYIGELVMAIESVHKMKFIHRDIKPDNILIDRDGHIKLTDFGLCTGFRWTHDSKYYQCSGYETVELGFSNYKGDLGKICEDFSSFNDFDEINDFNNREEHMKLSEFDSAKYEEQQNQDNKLEEKLSKDKITPKKIDQSIQPEQTLPMNDEIVKKCDKCLKRIQIFEVCDKCKHATDKNEGNCFNCIKLRNQIIVNMKICNNCNKPLERRRRRQNLRNQAHSLVGTPNYIAPEVLQKTQKGYSQSCDWWSVGIILYEMLVGHTPFHSEKSEETQYKVCNWQDFLVIPQEANLSPEAIDLILKLCTSAENRLGNGGVEEIKQHPFFNGFDFTSAIRQTEAPLKPKISHPTDTSNFDGNTMELNHDSDLQANIHNYANNDYIANSDDESNSMKRNDNGYRQRRNREKVQEHRFFEFTFRRFEYFEPMSNLNSASYNTTDFDDSILDLDLDINNLDINLDGTLKLGSLKSNRELNLNNKQQKSNKDKLSDDKEMDKKNDNSQVYI